ncbi:hypothetical protein GDO78_008533 [Eleutherodactylus coqui]|uniref:ethanolamine kinase n=1 Tax=Eleutherodactylus coqui TaxID=57060 RepID=A0A8J6FF72_ELECQ|nr:hypothetical protein GDO78_008533 [Eleutherodactylus coqui]
MGEQRRPRPHSPHSAGPAVRALSITVDEQNVIPGALRLIRELRPAWDLRGVHTKLFTDGITNKLLACYVDSCMKDAVLVRIYGKRTELFVDREDEVTSFQLLRTHGCAPELYCTFQNGLCYEFIRGLALGPEHVRQPHILRLIAHEMAKYHCIPAHNGCLPKAVLWQKLNKYLSILHTEEEIQDSEPDYRLLPDRETQLEWLWHYLCACRRLKGEEGEPQDKEVDHLLIQVNQFVLASHYFWGLWALIQYRFSDIDFNFAQYAMLRFKQYFHVKSRVTELRDVK